MESSFIKVILIVNIVDMDLGGSCVFDDIFSHTAGLQNTTHIRRNNQPT